MFSDCLGKDPAIVGQLRLLDLRRDLRHYICCGDHSRFIMSAASIPKVTSYQLEAVWPTPSAAVREDVVRFWLAEGALPHRPTAEERAHQLLVVARESSGNVAGVSTAVRTFVPQFGFDCFFYRTFVGRTHRARGMHSTQLFWNILLESYRFLNERFLHGCDSGVLGLYAEIESRSLMQARKDLVWQHCGMNVVYIGRTPDGRHVRVWYFDGARIP
jgi:hypothetical protein